MKVFHRSQPVPPPPYGVVIVNPAVTTVYTLTCAHDDTDDPAISMVAVTVTP